MYVLDTDHLSLLDHRGSLDRQRLLRKLKLVAAEGVSTTIVTFEEQMRGRLAYLSRARTMAGQIEGYRRLREHLDNCCSTIVLGFDERAAEEFQRLKGRGLESARWISKSPPLSWLTTPPSFRETSATSEDFPTSELKTGFPRLTSHLFETSCLLTLCNGKTNERS